MSGLNNSTGENLSGLDHIKQSLADILTTPLNTRVMRRDYGSACAELIGQPLNNITLLQMYSACSIAIAQWEPRVRITAINRTLNASQPGQVTFDIDLVRLDTGSEEAANLSITLHT